MRKNYINIFQVAVVFIGTIVGAGLASGKEITHFFTSFGYKSFLGIILCGSLYIIVCTIISKISSKNKLTSYSELMQLISPNILGKATGIITTLYLISSSSIILAGSGALINEFFGLPKIAGSLIMVAIAYIFLLRGTDGLIEVNSFIVPLLITVLSFTAVLYLLFRRDTLTFQNIINFPQRKDGLLLSTILYSGYNILCSCGVLVPLSTKIKNSRTVILGIILGSIGLTLVCIIINLLLTVNQPYIYNYEIPLLFVANPFGSVLQGFLLIIILLEMFSTEVSDVYSISKTLNHSFNIDFNRGILLILAIDLPISQIGFTNLISTLYPFFGALSLIFIFQCILYFFRKKPYT